MIDEWLNCHCLPSPGDQVCRGKTRPAAEWHLGLVGLILGQLAARALKGGGFAAKGAHRTAQLVQRGFVDPGRGWIGGVGGGVGSEGILGHPLELESWL
jgi:hypothetical protein